MKQVRIQAGFVGLVMKRGNLQRVLTEGSHWIGFTETVDMYDMARPFKTTIELTLLLGNEMLAEMLTVVSVKDNEIAVHIADGIYKSVLTPGKYAFWKGLIENEFETYKLDEIEVPEGKIQSILNKPEVVQFLQVHVVESFQKGLMFVDGKFVKELISGVYFFWKSMKAVSVLKADLRQQQMEVSGQEILTKDKTTLRINLQAIYKIVDIKAALVENKDAEKQLYTLIQLALREFVGRLSIDEMLAEKETVSVKILESIREKALKLGLAVSECGIRDIILPGEIREIMNQVLVAQKRAEANMITRREETASTRSLLNTAKLMEDNTMLWKMKEMEFIEKIADKISTISISGNGGIVDQLKEIFKTAR